MSEREYACGKRQIIYLYTHMYFVDNKVLMLQKLNFKQDMIYHPLLNPNAV